MFKKYLKNRSFDHINIELKDKLLVSLPEGNLSDILTEIAINLRRNTPPNGKVKISTYDKNNEVHLIVENEGIHIPEKDLTKVFEPFFRYQDSMNHSSGYEYQQAGAGMGLTIMKRNIINAGGRVWFENKPCNEIGKLASIKLTIVLPGIKNPNN